MALPVALLVFCAARYRSPASRLLTSPLLSLSAKRAIQFYLVHSIVLISAVKLTGSAVHSLAYNVAKIAILMTFVIVISRFIYTCYEAPASEWLRARRPSQIVPRQHS
jgi:peptidoglycan/LPS O-acetylase OafA/YrhL